jgi:oligoendopeptidase F
MKALQRPPRKFIPEDFKVTTWDALEPFYQNLLGRELSTMAAVETLLRDISEIEAVLEEDFAWRYIKINCHTEDEKLRDHFTKFVEHIQPQLSVWGDKLNNKIVQCEFFKQLPASPYLTYQRSLETSVKIFRNVNVPLFTQLEKTAQQFGQINGAMTINLHGEQLTMQAASQKLESQDCLERETVFKLMANRRLEDKDRLNEILDTLIADRHQVALNAGFKNFRDYQFAALGRFDYDTNDCKTWHDAVQEHMVPLVKIIHQNRAKALQSNKLKPWDLAVDPSGEAPLKPFMSGQELLDKTKKSFNRLDPQFKGFLETMETLGHFDLESRKNKAPGGFNYPLYEIGAPFIFMNAVGTQRDLETMVHEGGHAIHSFLSKDFTLNEFKSTPAEVAELASMSMEMISMETWDEFYEDSGGLIRAKQQKIEDAIITLPWVAIVDKFQHWLYENPEHTHKERNAQWLAINEDFSSGIIDYTGFEDSLAHAWQKQMHIFEVPFYYIEYGFAQMGAISIWKNWEHNRGEALEGYKNFMKLGYTKTIPEIYEAAGIKFDFTSDYVKELADFMQLQLNRNQ